MTTTQDIIELDGLTINVSKLTHTPNDDGFYRLTGKVTITLVDSVDKTETVVTANYTGKATRGDDPALCDFEGESDDDALYEACEVYAAAWAAEIAKRVC